MKTLTNSYDLLILWHSCPDPWSGRLVIFELFHCSSHITKWEWSDSFETLLPVTEWLIIFSDQNLIQFLTENKDVVMEETQEYPKQKFVLLTNLNEKDDYEIWTDAKNGLGTSPSSGKVTASPMDTAVIVIPPSKFWYCWFAEFLVRLAVLLFS